MNKSIFIFFAGLMLLFLVGCKEDLGTIGDPFDKVEGLSDTWELVTVNMVDETESDPNKNKMDVSSFLVGNTPATLTFNGNDFTFSSVAGTSRTYLGTDGSWAFDDNDYPTKIMLDGGGTELALQGPTRSVDKQLKFKLARGKSTNCQTLDDTALDELPSFVSYEYVFERQ